MNNLDKPPILEIVTQYVDLRRQGRNYVGLCPLHAEKSRSFSVDEEKGLFYCYGCHEGGDVIRFIEKIENMDFKGALAHLGLADQPKPTRAAIKKRETIRQASRNLVAWALALSERIGTRMRENGLRAYTAWKVLRELPEADERLLQATIEKATREWQILSTLEEDVLNPTQTATLWEEREMIERLVENNRTYTNEEINERFNYC